MLAGAAIGAGGIEEVTGTSVAVGGTHEVCERGWLPHHLEVGLYGRPVAPRLLVAVGVDPTPEDAAGFVKAAVVVSLGTGGGAWADLIVDGDWRELLPQLSQPVS